MGYMRAATPLRTHRCMDRTGGLVSLLLVVAAGMIAPRPARALENPFSRRYRNTRVSMPRFSNAGEMPPDYRGCPNVPTPTQHVIGYTFYVDAAASIIDERRLELNRQAVQPVSDLADGLSAMAANYWGDTRDDPAPAQCSVKWLQSWARAGGLLGITNRQGNYTIMFRLSQISLAYLRIKDEPSLDARDKAEVEKWLHDVAFRVVKPFSMDDCLLAPTSCHINNKNYWGGLAFALAGLAGDDKRTFDTGLSTYDNFLRTIRADGFLPNELSRAKLGLNYHGFSATALIMIAYIAKANSVDLLPKNNFALNRLVDIVCRGYFDPSFITSKVNGCWSDCSQTPFIMDQGSADLAALEVFLYLVPTSSDEYRMANSVLDRIRPLSRQLLGGYTSYLYSDPSVYSNIPLQRTSTNGTFYRSPPPPKLEYPPPPVSPTPRASSPPPSVPPPPVAPRAPAAPGRPTPSNAGPGNDGSCFVDVKFSSPPGVSLSVDDCPALTKIAQDSLDPSISVADPGAACAPFCCHGISSESMVVRGQFSESDANRVLYSLVRQPTFSSAAATKFGMPCSNLSNLKVTSSCLALTGPASEDLSLISPNVQGFSQTCTPTEPGGPAEAEGSCSTTMTVYLYSAEGKVDQSLCKQFAMAVDDLLQPFVQKGRLALGAGPSNLPSNVNCSSYGSNFLILNIPLINTNDEVQFFSILESTSPAFASLTGLLFGLGCGDGIQLTPACNPNLRYTFIRDRSDPTCR